jgi:alanine dehydrogenase
MTNSSAKRRDLNSVQVTADKGDGMIIGIPKESMRDERRVALTPAAAFSLAKAGQTVIVQAEAGRGSGFSNEAYREAGATIAFSPEEIFARADVLIKVMPPNVDECGWIPEKTSIFSGVHFGAANPRVHEMLRQRGATAVGFELIEDSDHNLPVLVAMSEIAGMLVPQIAARYLETTHGGRGVLLGGIPGVPASNVMIIGAGNVGSTSARIFRGLGANVTVMDGDLKRLRTLETSLYKTVNTALATPYNIERYLASADVLVGAVMIHGSRAPHVVTEAMVKKMKPGSVILDVSIDQGGCVETSRPTALSDPIFSKHGVTHYCVPNIPSSIARTASYALSNVLLGFVESFGEDRQLALRKSTSLRRGVYLYGGACTHEGLSRLFGWEYVNIDQITG